MCNVYSFASLSSFAAGERERRREGERELEKQTGGYEDTGLPSLVHQPIGLDGIHQLPRIRRLPLSLSLSPCLSPSTLAPTPPVLCQSIVTLFLPSLCPPPLRPSPFLPAGDGWTCAGVQRNLFGLPCQPIFIKCCGGIFSCYASLLWNGEP